MTPKVREPRRRPARSVAPGLQRAAGYAWRLVVLALAVYLLVRVLGRLVLPVVAVFVGLVITSVLRPAADLLARRMPRPLAVAVSVLGALLLLAGVLALIGASVADEWGSLVNEFRGGMGRIEHWLEGPPLRIGRDTASKLQSRLGAYLASHRATLISTAVSQAGRVVEMVTGAVLALFCAVFFIHSGDRMWAWLLRQLPLGARASWDRGGRAAWRTFAGYTRGIFIVAATNAVLVGIALAVLRVPLVIPLMVLEFFATLVPLIGSPIAMLIAAIVALATRGPLTAVIVLVLIVVIGQIEGHLLQPVVMSWAVRIHPVAVALSVIAGGVLAGVVGAVVALPLVSVVWAVVSELRTRTG